MTDDNNPVFDPPLFRASELKIARASRHVAELSDMIAAHLIAHPPPYLVAHPMEHFPPLEAGGPRRVKFRMDFNFPGVPDETGAIIGDAIHNLRAALDLMASDLARWNRKNPANVYFPFSETPDELDLMVKRRRFDLAGERAVELLKAYQPYRGGNVALRAIHDLDVDDKHKFLIPTFQTVAGPPFQFRDVEGVPEPAFVEAPPSPLLVVFPAGPFEGKEIIPTLHELVKLTAGIVEAFKALTAVAS